TECSLPSCGPCNASKATAAPSSIVLKRFLMASSYPAPLVFSGASLASRRSPVYAHCTELHLSPAPAPRLRPIGCPARTGPSSDSDALRTAGSHASIARRLLLGSLGGGRSFGLLSL